MVLDCVAGVHHLHRRAGVMHRDLKEENLLITIIDGQPHVKVCDFGASTLIPDNADDLRTTYCGTPLYFAPEMWCKRHERQYDKSIDIFALGLIIWSILHRRPLQGLEPPMDGDEPIGYSWMSNVRGPDWAPLPFKPEDGVLAALVVHMVQFRPKDRPSIQMAKDIVDAHLQDVTKCEKLSGENARLNQLYENDKRESCKVRDESERLKRQNIEMKTHVEKVEDNNLDLGKKIEELEKVNIHLRERIDDLVIENGGLKSKLENEAQTFVNIDTSLEKKYKAAPSQLVSVPVVIVPPTVKKVTRVEISENRFVGFGDDCVIVESDDNLNKWAIEGETKPELCKSWSKPKPNEVTYYSSKCVLHDGRIAFRSEYSHRTYIFTNDIKHKLGHYEGDIGLLRGAIRDNLVYCKNDEQGTYKLHLYSVKPDVNSRHEFVCTLPMSVKSDLISVCDHPSGYFAVIDNKASTLDIYSAFIHHIHRVQLPYLPWWQNAVAAVGDIIFVASCHELHVHNWAGEQLCEFSQQQLGVKEKLIEGVVSAGNRLLLTAGDPDGVQGLYAYDVISANAKVSVESERYTERDNAQNENSLIT